MEKNQEIDLNALFRLSSVPGVGSYRLLNLMKRFKEPGAVLSASPRQLIEVDGIDKKLAQLIKNTNNAEFASEQIKRAKQFNTKILTYWDQDYPVSLKNIYDPPCILYVRSCAQKLNHQSLAIVGTRHPSTYGKLITEKFAAEIARQNISVISGFARGVDTIAHKTVIANRGITFAVLGSGVDVIYPPENISMLAQIFECGALISEFPMSTKPDARNFPKRNRLISGLSKAVFVIEAGNKSGAIITAEYALDQGKEVFAVPGNITNPKSIGCNRLIQDGARLVLTPDDILSEYNVEKKKVPLAKTYKDASDDERIVLKYLSEEPLHIDILCQKCGLSSSLVLSILLSLELKSYVRQLAGKHFVKI